MTDVSSTTSAPVAAAPPGEPAPNALVCPRHGSVSVPIKLPSDSREFCPVCLADLLHRSSVHLLERVHLAPDPELEPAKGEASG